MSTRYVSDDQTGTGSSVLDYIRKRGLPETRDEFIRVNLRGWRDPVSLDCRARGGAASPPRNWSKVKTD